MLLPFDFGIRGLMLTGRDNFGLIGGQKENIM